MSVFRLLFNIIIGIIFFVPWASYAQSELTVLPPEKAFILTAVQLNPNEATLKLSIAPDYLLYRQQFQFQDLEGHPIDYSDSLFPPTLLKHDDLLNKDFAVYKSEINLLLPLPASTLKNNSPIGLRIAYQGCSEEGFCYAPRAQEIIFQHDGSAKISELNLKEFRLNKLTILKESISSPSLEPDRKTLSDSDFIIQQLHTNSMPTTLFLFLGLGLLLAFTPCVLPMVPIMANILIGSTILTTRRATLLASGYILSMASCYAFAGIAAGFIGSHLQITLQKPIFLISFSFVLCLFALTQLNIIQLQLPQFFGDALHRLERKQKQGSLLGAIAMGGLSALMVSPCVTPALVGALTYIGQTGNALLGGLALFALAIGMGLPLLIAASFGSHLLPKTGAWMGYAKIVTGVFLLVLSGSILSRAFPNMKSNTSHPPNTLASNQLLTPINSEEELNLALNRAKQQGKEVIVEVSADWCISCQRMNREIFDNRDILSNLNNKQLLLFDLTQPTEKNTELQKKYSIVGPPTILFFKKNGEEAKNYRLVGSVEPQKFVQHVQQFEN